MKFLNSFLSFVKHLDRQEFIKYAGGYALGVLLLLTGTVLWRYFAVSSLDERFETLSETRERVQSLMTKNDKLKKEQKRLDEIIKGDFSLAEAFTNMLSGLGLRATKEVPTKTTPINNQYDKRSVTADISELDMKQITQLIQAIDQNERIIIEELTITRKPSMSLDISITVATLVKKV